MSKVTECFKILRWNSNLNSNQTYRECRQEMLSSLIKSGIKFQMDDWEQIKNEYYGYNWLGVSSNGKHHGEYFYKLSCQYNNSSAISYEKAYGREMFKIKHLRVFEGFEFKLNNLYWFVTGWSEDNKEVTTVGYKNRSREGKRKLMRFNKEKWLQARKEFTAEAQ